MDWDNCPIGSGVAIPGGAASNLVCEVCPEGKFSEVDDDTPCQDEFDPLPFILLGTFFVLGVCAGVGHYQYKKWKARKELARRRARIKPKRRRKKKKWKSGKKKKKKKKNK